MSWLTQPLLVKRAGWTCAIYNVVLFMSGFEGTHSTDIGKWYVKNIFLVFLSRLIRSKPSVTFEVCVKSWWSHPSVVKGWQRLSVSFRLMFLLQSRVKTGLLLVYLPSLATQKAWLRGSEAGFWLYLLFLLPSHGILM